MDICTSISKTIQDFQAIIAVIIAIIGWFATYLLNKRVQKNNLINQLQNTARLEIVSSLKDYQIQLNSLRKDITALNLIPSRKEEIKKQEIISILNHLKEYSNQWGFNSNTNNSWEHLMKEYYALIPELKLFQSILNKRHHYFSRFVFSLTNHLYENLSSDDINETLKQLFVIDNELDFTNLQLLIEQDKLISDIIIYLQISFFSRIRGNNIRRVIYPNQEDKQAPPRFVFLNGELNSINDYDDSLLKEAEKRY